jgi:hypothetical protein
MKTSARSTLEGTLDPVEAGLDDRIGQLKIVEALAEFRQFFFLAPLQLLQRFLVMATAGVALGEKTSYRQRMT